MGEVLKRKKGNKKQKTKTKTKKTKKEGPGIPSLSMHLTLGIHRVEPSTIKAARGCPDPLQPPIAGSRAGQWVLHATTLVLLQVGEQEQEAWAH